MATSVPALRPANAPALSQIRTEYDRARRESVATRRLYGTSAWRAISAAQKQAEPLCRMCAAAGRVTPMAVCDHVEPHRGDVEKFFAGPFQSLCKRCHDSTKQREERSATRAI